MTGDLDALFKGLVRGVQRPGAARMGLVDLWRLSVRMVLARTDCGQRGIMVGAS
jgi:hypothetical protein